MIFYSEAADLEIVISKKDHLAKNLKRHLPNHTQTYVTLKCIFYFGMDFLLFASYEMHIT